MWGCLDADLGKHTIRQADQCRSVQEASLAPVRGWRHSESGENNSIGLFGATGGKK